MTHDQVTVVITDDDHEGIALMKLAEQWHSDDLVGEFAMVSPASVRKAGYGPPTITAKIIGQSDPVELMAYLGRHPRRLIRLVVVNLLTHEDSSAVELVSTCDEVSSLVKRAMPTAVGNDRTARVRLLRMNLLVPESDIAPQRIDLLQSGWEVNAVVSPEDRPELNRLSVFVRASTNLIGHALASAVTLGGLWRGMSTGPFDRRELDSTTGAHDVVVVRCQARLIVGDDRSARLARGVIDWVSEDEDGAVRSIAWGVVSDRPARLVESSVDTLLKEAEWATLERQPDPLMKQQMSLGRLVDDWFRFQARLPLAALGFLGGQARSALERGVTHTFVGNEAGVVGRVHPMNPDEAAALASARLDDLARQLEPRRLEQDAATWGQATPGAWRTLRELSIGLVDGSDLPPQFVRQRRGALDEVVPPSFVATDPTDELKDENGVAVRGVDVGRAAQILEDSRAHEASEGEKERPTDDEASDTEPLPVETWVERRRDALLWRLAERAHQTRNDEEARSAEAALQLEKNAQAPDVSELERARKLLIASWLLTLLGMAAGALWLWTKRDIPLGEWVAQDVWGSIAKGGFILLAVFLAGGHNYYRVMRKYEWSVRSRLHALRCTSDEFVVASQQRQRWQLLYDGILDWNDILSQLLHRPWAPLQLPDERADRTLEGLPAAVAVASPTKDSVAPSNDLIIEAAEAICHRGWLKEEFGLLLASGRANDPRRYGGTGDLPADLDLGLRERGPRSDLRRAATEDATRRAASQQVFDSVVELVDRDEIRVPELTVARLGEFSGEAPQDHRRFLSGSHDAQVPFSADVFSDRALVSGQQVPESTYFTVPGGVPDPQLQGAVVDRSGVSLATRVDISRTLQPSDLVMFVQSRERRDAVTMVTTDDFN